MFSRMYYGHGMGWADVVDGILDNPEASIGIAWRVFKRGALA